MSFALAPSGKHPWPKVLRKAPVLPITFRGGDSSGVGGVRGVRGGRDSVAGSVTGMIGDVRGRGGVTGGTSRGAGGMVISGPRRGVGAKCSGARLAHRDRAAHPGPPRFDSLARPVIFRVLLLEAGEDMAGAVSSPEHQCPVVLLVEPPGLLKLHRASICLEQGGGKGGIVPPVMLSRSETSASSQADGPV